MTENSKRELRVTRLLRAPRELVWKVWTDPEHIKHWWGPNGFTNTISKMDVRKEGTWEFTMHGPDGTDYKNRHRFIELVEPERIVLQHESGPKFKLTATFEEQGNDTLVTLLSEFESAEQLREVIRVFKADEGLVQNMDRLQEYLENKLLTKIQ